jgi:hypothetical protein
VCCAAQPLLNKLCALQYYQSWQGAIIERRLAMACLTAFVTTTI